MCLLIPNEEAILEVLFGIQVNHPPRALELDLIEGLFQSHGKEGDLLINPLADLIEVLHEDIK